VPRLPIKIFANGIQIFGGIIQDWNLDYDLANNDIVYATCADDFSVLSSINLMAHTVTAELSGARINTVLNYSEVQYQGARAIGNGSSTLGSTASNAGFSIAEDTNLLNYLQTVATSEQGYLFISADGTLTFKGRNEVLNRSADAVFTGNSSLGIPYQTLMNQFGDELLFNVIVTESPAGGPFTNSDESSIAQYQALTYTNQNLLNSSASEVQQLGQYLLGKFKKPELRFTGLSTQLLALSTEKQNICLNLDLTDICNVVKQFAVGNPSSVDQTLIVSGISHNITPGSHIISYTFESTDGNQYLTLNNTIFGRLDENLLAF
jgi:hypothetical protein